MSLLHDPNFLAFDGTPVTGRAPPSCAVVQGTLSEAQRGMAAKAFADFKMAVKLSITPFVQRTVTLPDGSTMRMTSNYGVDQALIWPVGSRQSKDGFYVAYPVYYDLGYCPVFTRTVFDAGSATTTDPPVYVPFVYRPYPVDEGLYRTDKYRVQYGYIDEFRPAFDGQAAYWTVVPYIKSFSYVEVSALTLEPTGEIVLATAGVPEIGQAGDPIAGFSAYIFVFGVGIKKANYSVFSEAQYAAFITVRDTPSTGSDGLFNLTGPFELRNVSATAESLNSAIEGQIAQTVAYNNVLSAAYSALVQAYFADYPPALAAHDAAYAAVYAAWAAANAPGRDGPAPLLPLRITGRAVQISALKNFLDAGVQPPHLMARNLALPFNIGTKPVLALATTGTLVTAPSTTPDTTGQYRTVTVTDAMHLTVETVPITFGRDVAQNSGLFSWKATGTYQLYQNYPGYHSYEQDEIRPQDLSTLSFTERVGYTAFANGGFTSDAALDLTVQSDACLPPGTSVLIVHYEYETFDSYTNAWIWTPCVELVYMDSIWVKGLGNFSMPASATTGDRSPRALRARKITQQTRADDYSWSAASVLNPSTLPSGWDASQTLTSSWAHNFFPSAVVVISGLDDAAQPIAGGTTLFPFGAKHLWSGDQAAIDESLEQPWATAVKIERIVAHGIELTGLQS